MSDNNFVTDSLPSCQSTIYSKWCLIPEPILIDVLNYLSARAILNVGQCCRRWNDTSKANYLWKKILRRDFQSDRKIELKPDAESWLSEYKRLTYNVPKLLTDDIRDAHNDEVLHVSFSHNGKMFATCSKDGRVIIWNSSYPATVKCSYDLTSFGIQYTLFSQFNQSDTLIMVSGTRADYIYSGFSEIFVFSVIDELEVRCRIKNLPFDTFGSWMSDNFLISGDCQLLPDLASTSIVWLNEINPKIEQEHVPTMHHLYKISNKNGGVIRNFMVANCPWLNDVQKFDEDSKESNGECSDGENISQKFFIFTTSTKTFVPHQVGFKMIRNESVNFPERLCSSEAIAVSDDYFDTVDEMIDLHGQIFGMSLSPDHRYLFVHSGNWSPNYIISDPEDPPPIGQEAYIHVIDLKTLKKVDQIFQSHKNYPVTDEVFYIFPDVCENYIASGAEDSHACVWDRHYEICLAKNPHTAFVNSVAFNPRDSEMLVTASDDYTIKIWRSMNKVREMRIDVSLLGVLE